MAGIWRVNGLSVCYAVFFFLQSELMVNIYRIERITGWPNVNGWAGIFSLLLFLGSTLLGFFLSKRLKGAGKIIYFASILWLPYYLVFIRLFAHLAPITDPQEMPLPGVGVVLIGFAIVMPFYIALIQFLASIRINA